MTRRYEGVWKELKLHTKITIKCHPRKLKTIVQGLKKEKARENAPKRDLELPFYGELLIERKISEDGKEAIAKITLPKKLLTGARKLRAEDL